VIPRARASKKRWIMKNFSFIGLGALFLFSSVFSFDSAAASGDSSVLPSCVSDFKSGLSLRFRYSPADKYERRIWANLSLFPCHSPMRSLRTTSPLLPDGSGWIRVPLQADALYGVRLPRELKERIAQAQLGADVYRPPGRDASSIAESLLDFSVEENRRLTRDYGNGFAGQVYRAWVEKQPQNIQGHGVLMTELDRQISLGDERGVNSLAKKAGNTVLVVAMGIGWQSEITDSTPAYVSDFIRNISGLGLETRILSRPAFGTMEVNAQAIERQLRVLLESGKDVMLFGLCKGAPEVLAAATRVMKPYLDEENRQTRVPEGHGKIVGSISISGMFSGILFADALERLSLTQGVDAYAMVTGARFGLGALSELGAYLSVMRDVTSERVKGFTAGFYPDLPSDIAYLNSTGVIPGNALLGDQDTTAMNPFIKVNRRFNLARGANDGFIEYPGNLMPKSVAPSVYDFVFDASHMISDGIYHGRSLRDPRVKSATYRAFVNLALDLSEASHAE
jgi:hypothetical protein